MNLSTSSKLLFALALLMISGSLSAQNQVLVTRDTIFFFPFSELFRAESLTAEVKEDVFEEIPLLERFVQHYVINEGADSISILAKGGNGTNNLVSGAWTFATFRNPTPGDTLDVIVGEGSNNFDLFGSVSELESNPFVPESMQNSQTGELIGIEGARFSGGGGGTAVIPHDSTSLDNVDGHIFIVAGGGGGSEDIRFGPSDLLSRSSATFGSLDGGGHGIGINILTEEDIEYLVGVPGEGNAMIGTAGDTLNLDFPDSTDYTASGGNGFGAGGGIGGIVVFDSDEPMMPASASELLSIEQNLSKFAGRSYSEILDSLRGKFDLEQLSEPIIFGFGGGGLDGLHLEDRGSQDGLEHTSAHNYYPYGLAQFSFGGGGGYGGGAGSIILADSEFFLEVGENQSEEEQGEEPVPLSAGGGGSYVSALATTEFIKHSNEFPEFFISEDLDSEEISISQMMSEMEEESPLGDLPENILIPLTYVGEGFVFMRSYSMEETSIVKINETSFSDPCRCGDPDNGFNAAGTTYYFHDVLSHPDTLLSGTPIASIELVSATNFYSDVEGNTYGANESFIDNNPISDTYTLDFWREDGVLPDDVMVRITPNVGTPFVITLPASFFAPSCTFASCQASDIPTISEWGLIFMTILILIVSVVSLSQYRRVNLE